MRNSPHLRQFDVVEKATQACGLGARKTAEGIEPGYAEMFFQTLFSRGGVKPACRKRRERDTGGIEDMGERSILKHPIA